MLSKSRERKGGYFSPILISCFITIAVISYKGKATAQEFFIKSERTITGTAPNLGVSFSSDIFNDGSLVIGISLQGKQFTAIIPQDGPVSIEGIFTKSGKPAKLALNDVVVLTRLYKTLSAHFDYTLVVDQGLSRFVAYLVDFHPVGEYFDNKLTGDAAIQNNPASIESISLCDKIGEKIVGFYGYNPVESIFFPCGKTAEAEETEDGGVLCIEEEFVGSVGNLHCFGRCGRQCLKPNMPNRDNVYSQDCFNHDLCVRATGFLLGPCKEEFKAAVDDFFRGEQCTEDSL